MRKAILGLAAVTMTVPAVTTPAFAIRQGRYARSYDRNGNYVGPVWRGEDGRRYCRRSNGTTGLIIGGAARRAGRTRDRRRPQPGAPAPFSAPPPARCSAARSSAAAAATAATRADDFPGPRLKNGPVARTPRPFPRPGRFRLGSRDWTEPGPPPSLTEPRRALATSRKETPMKILIAVSRLRRPSSRSPPAIVAGEEAPSPDNRSGRGRAGRHHRRHRRADACRQEHYKAMGKAMKGMGDQLKSDAPSVEEIQRHAALIAGNGPRILTWFPEGSGAESGRRTRAKAEVWTDAATFRERAQAFEAEVGPLQPDRPDRRRRRDPRRPGARQRLQELPRPLPRAGGLIGERGRCG